MSNRISDTARTEREAGKMGESWLETNQRQRRGPEILAPAPTPAAPEIVPHQVTEREYARAEAAAAIVKAARTYERRFARSDLCEDAHIALLRAVQVYNALAED